MNETLESLARIYADHRPPYPQQLIDDLRERTIGDRGEHLIDWGAGTGELTLRLSRFFEEVTAMDGSEPMVTTGKENARRLGVENIEWIVHRAEEVAMEDESCDLITVATAFHWMDRDLLAKRAFQALKPGGALSVVTSPGSGHVQNGTAEWHEVVKECQRRYSGQKRPQRNRPTGAWRSNSDLLTAAGFALESLDYSIEYSWRIDEIIGYLYSVGFPSVLGLGERRGAFERDLHEALVRTTPSGVLHDRLDFTLEIAHKP